MRKKTAESRKSQKKKSPDGIVFRERRLRDIELNPKHPKPIPGHKATLPGPPGWQYKENPGA